MKARAAALQKANMPNGFELTAYRFASTPARNAPLI